MPDPDSVKFHTQNPDPVNISEAGPRFGSKPKDPKHRYQIT